MQLSFEAMVGIVIGLLVGGVGIRWGAKPWVGNLLLASAVFFPFLWAVIGGDSICYVTGVHPAILQQIAQFNPGQFTISKVGKYPLDGVHADVTSFIGPVQMPGRIDIGSAGVGDQSQEVNLPGGLLLDRDISGRLVRYDLVIDFSGRSGNWHQVIHGIVVEQSHNTYEYFMQTYVIRDGKREFEFEAPGFAKHDNYRWRAH